MLVTGKVEVYAPKQLQILMPITRKPYDNMVAMQYCLGNAGGGEAVPVQFRFVFVFSKHFDSEVSATDMKE